MLTKGTEMKKQGNQVALSRSASLAATAWSNLEAAAQKAVNGGSASMRLYADTQGITAQLSDAHGTQILVQPGKISVKVQDQNQA
jgi:hypothetical protein